MKSKTTQWTLWAMAMLLFTGLTLSGHSDWLALAIPATALLWYSVVPSTSSR